MDKISPKWKTDGKLKKVSRVDGTRSSFYSHCLTSGKIMFLFLLVSYLVLSFFFLPNPGVKFLHRYMNCKFQLSLQKEKNLNPQNKYFGFNQINF